MTNDDSTSRVPEYDVFLSHASEDADWCEQLAKRLRNEGLRVWFDRSQLEPGDHLIARLNEGLSQSRKMVAVWSKAYFADEKVWTLAEGFAQQQPDVLAKGRSLIPVLIEDCDIPPLSRNILYIDFRDPADFERQFRKLLESVSPAGSRDPTRSLVPSIPQPHIPHPYPMQTNFTGRVRERRELTEWFVSDDCPVSACVAIGGMGKTALTWAWLQRDVLGLPLPRIVEEDPAQAAASVGEDARPEGVIWWSFYERDAAFQKFVDEALTYVSDGKVDLGAIPSTYERMQALYQALCRRRLLVMLDGVERILRAYASLDAPYHGDQFERDERGDFRSCAEPHAGTFLQWLTSPAVKSKVLLTSRLFPRELDDLAGCRHVECGALDAEDTVAFFHAQGVKGNRAEIRAACEPYGHLPLALRLLSGLIVRDKRSPGDIAVAARHPVLEALRGKEHHHILEVAYDALDQEQRELLSRIAAFRNPMTYDALAVLNPYDGNDDFDAALDELIDRGLLLFGRDRGPYDLHPIVRGYAYDRLTDKPAVHTRLRDYFDAAPKRGPDETQSLQDLTPVIELYHHTVRAGAYDEACQLYYDHLSDPLYFRLGAYQTCIGLLRALFPDGEDRPPPVKDESDQAWALNALAISHARSGQPRRAVPLYERQNARREKADSKRNLAAGLGNLAGELLILGELAAAERNLRRSIQLCIEIEDEFEQAGSRQELGRLLAYRGALDEADEEFRVALRSFREQDQAQPQCVVWAYRGLLALLQCDPNAALDAGRRARELADEFARTRYPVEGDFVRAEWLLGAVKVALACEESGRPRDLLPEAAGHLTEALTRCRRISLVESEPDILLAWARWHRAMDNLPEARRHAEEALAIADRCEYRLAQAEIHNFLARLDLDARQRAAAATHAKTAYERAWCDGPPHCYKPALDEAKARLDELGLAPPKMA